MTAEPNNSGLPLVLAFGELLWDLLPSGRALGGAPANFAYRLTSLGIPVTLASRVGKDDLGVEALHLLTAAGLSTELIQIDSELSSGTVDVFLKSGGVPDFTINPNVAYDRIELNQSLRQTAQQSALVLFGTLCQRSEQTRSSLYALLETAASAVKFLDINLRKACYSKETIAESLRRAQILKLNEDEVLLLSSFFSLPHEPLAEFYRAVMESFGIKTCLITLGERGVFACQQGSDALYLPGFKVPVVDTVGSGDSFSAGFVSCYLRGSPFKECCEFGNELGALVATKKGAMAEVTAAEIETFRRSKPERIYHPDFR